MADKRKRLDRGGTLLLQDRLDACLAVHNAETVLVGK